MHTTDVNMAELLPQRPPFILVDRLIAFDAECVQTALRICRENIFCDGHCLSESGLVENIAQTCAARMGYIHKYIANDTVKIGLIGAIRRMEIFRLPRIGEEITTRVTVREEIFRMTLVDALVTIDDEPIARAEMKISITDIETNV
ncbi:MAG: pseudouridylate synthase [Tannerellaceae bacterium]|nr:pseudouridylate synthase [Tannerellaceae bacterium]